MTPQESPTEIKLEETESSTSKSVDLVFPWLSSLLSLLFIGFLVINAEPKLIEYYAIPEVLLTQQSLLIMLAVIGLVYILESRYFLKKKHLYQQQILNLQEQLDTVWESKKIQQQRANIYSGHADKLKYFISEKLLETIEYDEKYLHFKGIAAEVRHNGVISYDKVITALNKAIDQQHHFSFQQQDDQQQGVISKQTTAALSSYQIAIDAIRYLWDLLDLSTAENMGLHIGNQLIECEEHYYQLNLDTSKNFEVTQSIPALPTFHPQLAALMTFAILLDESEINNLISQAKSDTSVLEEPFLFENEQFKIELYLTPALLGNPNHIILLLENLIKNAQFFNQKNRYKQKTDRIKVRLFPGDGYANFEIYNRGPQINTEEQEKIFTLGYTTRKNKQHHGKGLGLFFASEIVKGYNGKIQVKNISNPETNYTITLNLSGGVSMTKIVTSQWIDGRIQLRLDDDNHWEKELSIISEKPIQSIEISSDIDPEVFISENIVKGAEFEWLDPSTGFQPKWDFQLKPFKKQHQLIFKPLDISGVCFNIKLPTADSRLNEQELDFEDEEN